MLILAFPIFGIIMYLLVGLNGHTYKMRQRYDAVDAIVLPMLDQGPGADHVKSSMEELRDKNEQLASISYYLQEKSGFPVYADCPITYYDEAYKEFEAQKEALKKGKALYLYGVFCHRAGRSMESGRENFSRAGQGWRGSPRLL